jgi:cytochrome c oxidase subunit 4
VRALVLTWLALLALMGISLGSSYLRLGIGNVIAGLVIATIKVSLVVWWFMALRRASAITRIAAALGLATLLLLMLLSASDYATRVVDPARWQMPQQIVPLQVTPPPTR